MTGNTQNVVDPLAPSYPHNSPYAFSENRVIDMIELEGLEIYLSKAHKVDYGDVVPFAPISAENVVKFVYNTGVSFYNSGVDMFNYAGDLTDPEAPLTGFSYGADKFQTDVGVAYAAVSNYVETTPNEEIINDVQGVLTEIETYEEMAGGLLFGGGIFKSGSIWVKSIRTLKPCGCFSEGTPVLTEDGYKSIENIEVGDLIWAFDDETGQLALKKVQDTFTRGFNQIYRIYFGDEVIEVTHEHPFFIGGVWLNVDELKEGDSVTFYDSSIGEIRKIEFIDSGSFKVYNFTVDDYHTYYVSESNVLVHNGNPCFPFKSLSGKSLNYLKKKKPSGWKTVQKDNGKGWKWLDSEGNERLIYQRPSGKSGIKTKSCGLSKNLSYSI